MGDMLAWLHQATASEKEHLEALLKHVTAQGECAPNRENARGFCVSLAVFTEINTSHLDAT